MTAEQPIQILPAEFLGWAELDENRDLDIGGLKIHNPGFLDVYVRRSSADLSIIEIHMARHDGLSQEQLDEQNRQAEVYPLGAKEYWRGEMVGKYTYGADQHPMTEEEFEEDWPEGES